MCKRGNRETTFGNDNRYCCLSNIYPNIYFLPGHAAVFHGAHARVRTITIERARRSGSTSVRTNKGQIPIHEEPYGASLFWRINCTCSSIFAWFINGFTAKFKMI